MHFIANPKPNQFLFGEQALQKAGGAHDLHENVVQKAKRRPRQQLFRQRRALDHGAQVGLRCYDQPT